MKLGLAIAALAVLAGSAFAADAKKLESGRKPGEGMSVFDVVDVSGPNKGRQLCYI
jgi:hypothetical protein